jgi:cytochrome P450
MTKRLQVLLEDKELAEVQRAARRSRKSVAEWVRTALRDARAADAGRAPADKLLALRASARHAYPTGPIDQMLDEIERGYRGAP